MQQLSFDFVKSEYDFRQHYTAVWKSTKWSKLDSPVDFAGSLLYKFKRHSCDIIEPYEGALVCLSSSIPNTVFIKPSISNNTDSVIGVLADWDDETFTVYVYMTGVNNV